MKTFRILLLALLTVVLSSCTNNDDENKVNNPSGFTMSAKVNGTEYALQRATGGFEPDLHPAADFVTVQGWAVNQNSGAHKVQIYIDRDNLTVGSHEVNTPNNPSAANYLYFSDNTNNETEATVSGTLTITQINTSTKTIKGTFTIATSANPAAQNPVINYEITDGLFDAKYDVE